MSTTTPQPLVFVCPSCHSKLDALGDQAYQCPLEETIYSRVDGIWRFITKERTVYFKQFTQEYESVRANEGRGSKDPAYYLSLPERDLSGRWQKDWNIRARSYRALLRKVVKPIEDSRQQPLKILDIGAGNGWLSHRLALRGHQVAAVDLLTNEFDGLGAFIHYDSQWIPLQAEMNALPLLDKQVDLLIYNASFHYSMCYTDTLKEAIRVLAAAGTLVILDTPVYHDPNSGAKMVIERESNFTKQYGFPSNSIPFENYLTYQRLDTLEGELGIEWQIFKPYYGLRWLFRPWWARLMGQREPAQFLIIVAQLGVT